MVKTGLQSGNRSGLEMGDFSHMSHVGLSEGHGNRLEAADFGSLSRQLDLGRKKNRFLKKIGLAIIVLLALLAYWFHDYFVGSYAELDNVSITQDASKPRTVLYSFDVKKGGYVTLGYEKSRWILKLQSGEHYRSGDVSQSPSRLKQNFTVFV